MRPRALRRLLVASTATAVALVASTTGGSAVSPRRVPGASSRDCPVHALDRSSRPVTVELWHVQAGSNLTALERAVDRFEAANPTVRVRLVQLPTYQDLFTKYKAALSSGGVPDLAQFEETTVQQLVDSESTIPMAACVKADRYSLRDFLDRSIAYYTTQGVLRAFPWTVSNPVLLYNRLAFRRAGLDPDHPPTTFAGLRRAAERLRASGVVRTGMALRVEPYVLEFLFAKSGIPYVDRGNGRRARATAAIFATPAGARIWRWWDDMVADGLAIDAGATPGGSEHLFAVGTGAAAMTFEPSGSIGRVYDVLSTGDFPDVEVGVAPLPALRPGGGVPVGDASLWLPRTGSATRTAAAWKLAKFLVSPPEIAAISVASGGGYIPIRRSATADPELRALWAARPFLRVPYDQLAAGPTNVATSGSVIGDYQGVRDAVRDAMIRMLTGRSSPARAIADAEREATTAIRAYNDRVG